MDTQEKLNMASKLGHTIANILGQPMSSKPDVAVAVEGLITALAAKARGLLQADEIIMLAPNVDMAGLDKAANGQSINEIIVGAHAATFAHYSDCSTNNRGVPELLAPCDCPARTVGSTECPTCSLPKTMTGPIPIYNEALTGYLRSEFEGGKIDHVVRVVSDAMGNAEFYIRPLNADGETVQFTARNF